MKNKKILNVSLLALSLITLITFILPISKIDFSSSLIIKIIYYITSGIMLASLAAVVVITIINLFRDEYKNIKLVEGLVYLSFLMVYINLVIFACVDKSSINLGYMLVCIEIFIAATLSQVVRLFQSKSELKMLVKELLVNPKSEENKNNRALKKANKLKNKNKKQKQEVNKKQGFTPKQNELANSEAASEAYEIFDVENAEASLNKYQQNEKNKRKDFINTENLTASSADNVVSFNEHDKDNKKVEENKDKIATENLSANQNKTNSLKHIFEDFDADTRGYIEEIQTPDEN